MASNHGPCAAERAPSADDIILRDQGDMIWALKGEIRQLQFRIDQLEGDVLPQLIARLTRLEGAAGRSASAATPADNSSSSASSRPNDAVTARAAQPFKLMLGERNLGLPPAVAAALSAGPLHLLLNRSCAAERSRGSLGATAASGAGFSESCGSAVGSKRRRHHDVQHQIRPAAGADGACVDAIGSGLVCGACDAGAAHEAGTGVAAVAIVGAGAVLRPHKRARVRGIHSPASAEGDVRGAGASSHAGSIASFDGDGGDLSAQTAVVTSSSVSAGSAAEILARPATPATAGVGSTLITRPRRAAGLAAAAAIRASSALETGASLHGRCSSGDVRSSGGANGDGDGSISAEDGDRTQSSDGHGDAETSSTDSDDESADEAATCDEADDHAGNNSGGRYERSGSGSASVAAGMPGRRARGSAAAAASVGGASKARSHLCPHCGRGFPFPSSLTRHIRKHTGEKPYACTQCDVAFTASSSLRTHERAVHTGERPFACTQCEAAFTRSGFLRTHERAVHAGERPYACTQCEAAFGDSSTLRRHERGVHSGERPYACTQCEAAFADSSDLRKHERAVHTGEKPYACTQCYAAFAASSSLRRHERAVHSGERLYACTQCEAAFADSSDLRKHERAVHTGEKPYACTQCKAVFSQSGNLRQHERAVHSGEGLH